MALLLAVLAWCVQPLPARAEDPVFGDDTTVTAGFPDPMECMNRATFDFNEGADYWVFDPFTRAYIRVIPGPVRRAARRVLTNLNSPAVFVNDVLQLRARDAGVTFTRFVVNTALGLVGIVDVASALGVDGHETDFGQTLALAGVPSGPYLIIPLFGPTTVRDSFGYLVDFLFRPTTYVLTPGAQVLWTSVREGSQGIAVREQHAAELHALEQSSVDYYAALRNAYWQDRVAQIEARRTGSQSDPPKGEAGAAPMATPDSDAAAVASADVDHLKR